MQVVDELSLIASISRMDFKFFVREFIGETIPGKIRWNWHIDVMCDELQEIAERVFRGETKKHDLICNISPGTTKSTIFSVLFPAWVWSRMPEAQFICVSYSHLLALDLSRKCRDVVTSDKYKTCFPEIMMREDANSKSYFINTAGGKRYSSGSRGTVLGMHAHFICFPYETLVQTSVGTMPIGDIVTRRLDVSVLGVDHGTGRLRWQKIEKYETNPGRPLCRIEFTDGTSLEATHDHPVFVSGRGYVFASDLKTGDQVVHVPSVRQLQEESLDQGVPGGEVAVRRLLLFDGMQEQNKCRRESSLLQGNQGSDGSLCSLPRMVSMRTEAVQELQVGRRILHQDLCGRTETPADRKGVRRLRDGILCTPGQERHGTILQHQLHGNRFAGRTQSSVAGDDQDPLSGLFDGVSGEAGRVGTASDEVLFNRVFQENAFTADVGSGQPAVHTRSSGSALLGEVSSKIDSRPSAGRVSVFSLQPEREDEGSRCSPHRLRQGERFDDQSGNIVSVVPRPDARQDSQSVAVGTKVVRCVVRAARTPETVYNLNVTPNHNYFAKEVLVHNCVDDPLDPNRALSEVELGSINHWMKATLNSRKVDKSVSVTLLVMQRLHQDDPTGEMLTRGESQIRHVCIPATTLYPIKPPELVNHYVNGLMDPVGLPQTYIDEISGPGGIGESAVAGQYGQQPFPSGGGQFKTQQLRWGDPPSHYKRLVRAWDKAATASNALNTKGPAYSVGTKMGLDYQDRVWILEVKRVRLDSFSREELIKRTALLDGKEVVIAVGQEPGSGGKESALGTIKRLIGYRVRAIPASGSKEVRADEFSVRVNGGLVFLPDVMREGNHWIGWAEVWVEELKHFPASTYKDQVDSAALGYSILAKDRIRVGPVRTQMQKEAIALGQA